MGISIYVGEHTKVYTGSCCCID